MASNALTFTLTPGMAPAAPLKCMLGRYDHQEIVAFTEINIALLDLWDGDGEAEEDDPPGLCDEDEIHTDLSQAFGGGPGCGHADPGGCEDDGREAEDRY